ncbi:hypothetical protein ElyMa_002416500 [Elysia marginata]|uniref:DUF1018 domain-containing protein n=1 Tax=Elysia marginata TaxID=1093978 RepID=A0AAV4GH28_9GAST|nr:hypothetical protein ElyMa_002416500 [Elysia marginata]
MGQRYGNDREAKLEFLSLFFDEDITSSKQLTEVQMRDVIAYFKDGKRPVPNWVKFDKNRRQHRYILSLCYQLGWKKEGYADLMRLSDWLKSRRNPVKKPLQAMTSAETNKVINALESMVKKIHRI